MNFKEHAKKGKGKEKPLTIVSKKANPIITKPQNNQNQKLVDTENQIAKVQEVLDYLANHPDYVPQTNDNEELYLQVTAQKKIESELLKKNESNAQIIYEPKTPKKNDPKVLSIVKKNILNVSKSKQKSSEIAETPPNSGQLAPTMLSKIPKLKSTSKVDKYQDLVINSRTKKDIEKLRETEIKIAEMKAQLAYIKKNPDSILQAKESKKVENKPTEQRDSEQVVEQPDSAVVVEYKNRVTDLKAELEILRENEEESYEDYAKRMKKSSRRNDSIVEKKIDEQNEIAEQSYEQEEELTENSNEECEETNAKEVDEEYAEMQEINEEEETEGSQEIEETNNENNEPLESDVKIDAQKKRVLIDMFKSAWLNKIENSKPNESVESEEVQSAERTEIEEENATEYVEEETQLSESTDNEVAVESLQSDPVKKNNVKFYNIEIKPSGTKKTDSVSPETTKEDIFTSFFKRKSMQQKELVSVSENSLLNLQKLQNELLENTAVTTRNTQEAHKKSTSKNVSKKSQGADCDSFSSFFDEKPSMNEEQRIQNKSEETVSDHSKSGSETKESRKPVDDQGAIATTSKDFQRQLSPPTFEKSSFKSLRCDSFSSFFDEKSSKNQEQKIQNKSRKPVYVGQQTIVNTSTDFQRQLLQVLNGHPSSIKCNLEQDKIEQTTSKGLKGQSTLLKCNMEREEKTGKTFQFFKRKIIDVLPCQPVSNIVTCDEDFEYSDDFVSYHSDKPTKPLINNTMDTEIHADEKASLKIEKVVTTSHSKKEGSKDCPCNLYKVKIKIKSLIWRKSNERRSVTLSFHNPYTNRRAPVRRKFVLPNFNTEGFHTYVPYVCPENMLNETLSRYPPNIFINKRNSEEELARGILVFNTEHLEHKYSPMYHNVALQSSTCRTMAFAVISVKVINTGFAGNDRGFIQIIYTEIKNKEMEIAVTPEFTLAQKVRKLGRKPEEMQRKQSKQVKSPPPQKSKPVKSREAAEQIDDQAAYNRMVHDREEMHFTEDPSDHEITAAIRKYLHAKKLTDQFFQVCEEQKPPLYKDIPYKDMMKYKYNYVMPLRDVLPSEFVTPLSSKNTEKELAEKQWKSHIAAFLNNQKGTLNDECSSTIDKTDDQVSEMQSEVATTGVLINNPDYQAMNKLYHPERCRNDVMTSTADPYFEPPTKESGVQTGDRVIKKFTAQTRKKTLQLVIKKPPKVPDKTSNLNTCLLIVDTIPSVPNGNEKLVNKNILYEKVQETDKFQSETTNKPSKITKLSRSNIQLGSYPEPCSNLMQEPEFVADLQLELRDFIKDIASEVNFLKYHAKPSCHYGKVPNQKTVPPETTDFDRLLKNFTSLVAYNEEKDFIDIFNELQELHSLVYNTFKKFSERYIENVELRSRSKQIKRDDKELNNVIYNNDNFNQEHKKEQHKNAQHKICDDGLFRVNSFPNMQSNSTLPYEANIFPDKKESVFNNNKDSESTLTPLGPKSKKISSRFTLQGSDGHFEVEKAQMEAIKKKMSSVQRKLRHYLENSEVLNNKNNENSSEVSQILNYVSKLLHEWRRLKSYVEQVYES